MTAGWFSCQDPRALSCLGTVLALLLLATGCSALCAEEQEILPASVSLHAARVLAGDGYERRAVMTERHLPAGKTIDLDVYLLEQNTYCFLLASREQTDALTFTVCDATGKRVEESSYLYHDGALHVLHLKPKTTGRHRLRVINLGATPAHLALTYCYR